MAIESVRSSDFESIDCSGGTLTVSNRDDNIEKVSSLFASANAGKKDEIKGKQREFVRTKEEIQKEIFDVVFPRPATGNATLSTSGEDEARQEVKINQNG